MELWLRRVGLGVKVGEVGVGFRVRESWGWGWSWVWVWNLGCEKLGWGWNLVGESLELVLGLD